MSGPFEQLFEISPFPAVVSRLSDQSVVAINQRVTDMFGIRAGEAMGQITANYYVNPADRRFLLEPILAHGRADDVVIELKRPDGHRFWARCSARIIDWNNEMAVLTVFDDISDELHAQRALKESEQRLAAQSHALTSLTAWHTNLNQTFEESLRNILETAAQTLAAERVSMWRFDEARSGIQCVDLYQRSPGRHETGAWIPRDAAPRYFAAIEHERVIAAHDARTDPRTNEFLSGYLEPNGIESMLDVPLRRGDVAGGVLCVEHVGPARRWTIDEQNFAVSTANLIAVAIADESRREALTHVAASDTRARLILDTAHDAFVGMNQDGRIAMWNVQAESTFGWSRHEVIGRVLSDTIIPADMREAHEHGMRRFLDTGEAPVVNRRLELRGLHRDGHEFPIEITISSPMRRGDGYFFAAFLRDISDRLERDEQLRRSKDAAEAATRAKSEFLANMSHELRTPLNGVIGYSQLLQRDRTLNEAQRDALDAITKCGTHLMDLINDVLDLSKIEAGRIDIETSVTDLSQLTTDLQHVLGEHARRKRLTLSMILDQTLPSSVVLDGRHLRQILLNLLGNGIKFTSEGEVSLAIGRDADGQLAFEVSDTGSGIEPESLSTIFEAFTQTESGAAAGGTGLGLTISQRLLRHMGSDLHVESVVGQGSRFFFALPLVPATTPAASAGADTEPALDARLAPGQDVTALVVDDSTVSRRILASLLESAGVRVITATGGLEAVDLARRHRPDVIFMDVRMPGLDGLSATKRLMSDETTRRIPVIAVTASAFGDTRAAATEAGCAAYLAKPVRAEALFAALRTHLGVIFVRGEFGVVTETHVGSAARHSGLVSRIRDAISIGAVSDLEMIVEELNAGSDGDAALAQRLARLVGAFDFDGVNEFAASLAEEHDHRNAD